MANAQRLQSPSLTTRFRRFVRTPKGHVLGALILLTGVGSRTPYGAHAIPHALIAVAAAVLFDAAVAKVMERKVTFSIGGVITALIVTDVLSSITPVYLIMLTTVLALSFKHLLKQGRKPLFNPAAAGLLATALVFSGAESWWASMPNDPMWVVLLMLAAGIFVAVRVKKYLPVLVFLGTYFTAILAMALLHWGLPSATPADALRAPFVNAALFVAFFMLTDPPTSPGTVKEQVPFAIISALVAVAVYDLMGGLVYLLVGLLVGNGLTAIRARQRRKADRHPAPARSPVQSFSVTPRLPKRLGSTAGAGRPAFPPIGAPTRGYRRDRRAADGADPRQCLTD
ncbi:hypothetical protein HIJ39_21375 [Sulfobacillus sp. DSM 109850]|uniref:RnfABCDGE type electron transport complex subunit D n=1 Tax=Sulfobacillus harzensis TaxID=2729629 RepID=A0A7Y0L7Z6_9FIRM|nr:hypothetical protein [Sulfobacillus harzensis]